MGKPGFIASAVGAKVVLAISSAMQGVGHTGHTFAVDVGLLKSYEHMGTVNISFLVPSNRSTCTADALSQEKVRIISSTTVDCIWSAHASVYDVVAFSDLHVSADCMWVSFEIVPSAPPRIENKVKLLDITLIG